MGFAEYSINLKLIYEKEGDLSLQGRKLYPSESYIIELRHMLKMYRIPPWEWDVNYPEEMEGQYYPEDLRTIVGIDILESNGIKARIKKSQERNVS